MLLLAQVAPDSISPFVNALISLGGFGLMLILLLTGKLVPKSGLDEMRADRDAERQGRLNERERADAADKRADIAVETARTANQILSALKKSVER